MAFFAEAGSVRIVEVKARRRRRYKRRVSLRRRNAEIGDPGAPRRAGRIFGDLGCGPGSSKNPWLPRRPGEPGPARPAEKRQTRTEDGMPSRVNIGRFSPNTSARPATLPPTEGTRGSKNGSLRTGSAKQAKNTGFSRDGPRPRTALPPIGNRGRATRGRAARSSHYGLHPG